MEFPIQKNTSLEDMILRLQEDKISNSSSNNPAPIYITEDFNVTEAEDRPRAELRAHLKRMQKQRLLADGDFICFAHMARYDSLQNLLDSLQRLRICTSELDRISVINKRFHKCRVNLASDLGIEGISQVEVV